MTGKTCHPDGWQANNYNFDGCLAKTYNIDGWQEKTFNFDGWQAKTYNFDGWESQTYHFDGLQKKLSISTHCREKNWPFLRMECKNRQFKQMVGQ